MMKLENELSKKDLNVFKRTPLEHLIKEIIKYQNWQTEKALEHINYAPLKKATAVFYFNNVIRYLNNKSNSLSIPVKLIIDKFKNIIKLENPEENNKRRVLQLKTNKNKPILSNIKKEPIVKSLVEKFVYAVKIDNMIITFNTENEAKAFIQGYNFTLPVNSSLNIITINKKEIEEA